MKLLTSLVIYAVIISQLSLAFGLTQETWTTPDAPTEPGAECTTGFCAIGAAIQAALVPLRWVFNAVKTIFDFMTYQVDGIPALINTVIISPFGAGILLMGVRLIRGGG